MTPPPATALSARNMADEDRRIRDAFLRIGVDLADLDSVDEYQADRAFLRRQREASEVKSGLWVKSVFAAIGGIIATLVGSWIVGYLHLGPKP